MLISFFFLLLLHRKSDQIENLRIRNRILFGVFIPKDGLRMFPAPSTKSKPLWLLLACDLSCPWLAKIISVRSTTELTNFISPYSQAVSNSCCHTRRRLLGDVTVGGAFLSRFDHIASLATFHLMQALRQSQNPLCLRRQPMTKARKALNTCQKMTKRSLRVVL